MKRVWLFCFFSLILFTASAQTEVSFRRYTTNDGLSSNYVMNMVQDPRGSLWIGTRNGLCRFDGYQFYTYRVDKDGPVRLPHSNLIRQLTQNPNGLLWIRYYSDVYSCFDTNIGRFISYTADGKDPANLRECTVLPNGETWLWRNGTGALRVVYKKGQATSRMFSQKDGQLQSDNVHFIVEDPGHHVWIGTSKGMTLVEGRQGRPFFSGRNFVRCVEIEKSLYMLTHDGSVYQTTGDGKLTQIYDATPQQLTDIRDVVRMGRRFLILTKGDTYEYDTERNAMERSATLQAPNGYTYLDNQGQRSIISLDGYLYYIDASGEVTPLKVFPGTIQRESYGQVKVANDSKGHLWISTQGNGLFVYNLKTKSLQHFTDNTIADSRLGINIITNHLMDHKGNLWLTLDNQGIARATIVGRDQLRIVPEGAYQQPRASEMLTLSSQSDGSLLTSNHNHEVLELRQNGSQWDMETLLTVGDDNCRAVMRAKDGTLWAGTDYHGVNIGRQWFRHHDNDPLSLSNDHVTDLHQDRKGRVWLACAGGGLDLAEQKGDGWQFRHFFNQNGLQRKVLTIYECPHGQLFLGTDRGIISFDPDQLLADSSRYDTHFDDNPDNWFDIHCILELPGGRIAYSSTGAGLYISKSQNHRELGDFQHYTTANGLPDMTCTSMAADDSGMLWIGTQCGLARMNTRTGVINRFNLSSDLKGNVYANGQGLLLNNGSLIFATTNGLLNFFPKTLSEEQSERMALTVSNIYIGNTPMVEALEDDQTIDMKTAPRLKHYQNTLTFLATCFNYGSEATTEYSFLLEGEDNHWTSYTTQNYVTYSNLKPDTYTLKVRCRNTEQNNSYGEFTLQFTIDPPFWATWWARLIYIIIGVLVLWLIAHSLWTQYKLRRKLDLERRMTEFKSEFFMNISHELRTPLMLIQGSAERLRSQKMIAGEAKQPMANMQSSVDRLLRLTSQLLTFNKLQNDRLHLRLQQTDIVRLARDITQSFSDLAATRRMNLNFSTTTAACEVPLDRDMFDKMLYNLLSNAFKYTPDGGEIAVKLKTDESQLQIAVEDSGIGIKPEQKAELFRRFARSTVAVDSIGIGLNLAYQLSRLHHGTLTHQDHEGGGSIFTITLPLDDSSYQTDDWATEVEQDTAEENKSEGETYMEMPAVPLNDRRIVLAEDDMDVRQFLARELGRYFEVTACNDGQAALEAIRQQKPDLIVSDVVMPRMDGIELLKAIRQDDDLFDIPFILLTAMEDDKRLMQGIKSGADSYLPKPVSINLLTTRCLKLLEQYERLKQSFSQEALSPQQSPIIATVQDKKFRQILDAKIEARLSDPHLNIDDLGESMNFRHSQFFTRVKEVTGMPPGEYIRRIKMERAAQILADETVTISEAAYQLGFSDPLYFGRCFKQHYGITPSQYRKGNKKKE